MSIGVTDVVNPIIYAEAIGAATRNASAFMESAQASKLGMVNVSGSFTGDASTIGQTVNVPYFNMIGTFVDTNDGASAASQSPAGGLITQESATVGRSTLRFELTNWARNSPANQFGNIYQNIVQQVQAQAAAKMDALIVAAATATNTNISTGSKNLSTDVYSASVPRYMDSDLLVDARMLFEDFQENFAAVVMHPITLGRVMKLRDSTGNPIFVSYTDGGLPRIFGIPVIASSACSVPTVALSGSFSSSGTSPAITVGGTANRYVDLRIKCTTGGTLTNSKVIISIDGGKTYSRAEIATVGSGTPLVITDPHDGASTGVTVYWAAGTSVVNETWTATPTSVKVATHFVKRGAFGFWFNAAKLADLQSVTVPATDTTDNAVHLYAVCHRYNQLPGSRLPGVATVYHNG